MTGRRTDWQDLLFGLFLIAVAGIALAATRTLSGGTAADMGPGYMPRAIAIMLLAFGLWFSIRGIRRPFVGIAPVRLQPLLAITASVAVFALSATRFGLALSSFAAILIASLATREARPIETLLFALGLSAAAVLLFVKALALPVPIWPGAWF
jgi:Tripartite tricarboxylate transporter TctB family